MVDTHRPEFSLEEKPTSYEGELPANADKFVTTTTLFLFSYEESRISAFRLALIGALGKE